MCGFTGFWNSSSHPSLEQIEQIIKKMSKTLVHRGPDDNGTWLDIPQGIALAHRRLAILDLSLEAHQPMISHDKRYVIVFNGEIYNYLALKQELKEWGYNFKSTSDTEVMLAAFSRWGIEESLVKFNGMFAFALWDKCEHQLYLARDPMGEKPLYYGWVGSTLIFASELKAIKAYPEFQGSINRDALGLFLKHNYVPTPYSIYENIYKLPAGSFLKIKDPHLKIKPQYYWSLKSIAEKGLKNPFIGSYSDAIKSLDSLLTDAVKIRMIADVPLGAFLSGGIDSSTIVAIMQSQNKQKIKTFSIGFEEDQFNEAKYAKQVANYLGTDHHQLYITSEDALKVIPSLPDIYDEPFADSSQIPTFLLSKLARQQLTVSLSGDGGDELFYGYQRYFLTENIWHKTAWIPPIIRNNVLSKITWSDKLEKLSTVINFTNHQDLYHKIMSSWKNGSDLVLGDITEKNIFSDSISCKQINDKMMYWDLQNYLTDDILVKVDRASMAVSLESRIPLIDPSLIEFAWRIPLHLKKRNGQSKWLLRQVLSKYVPEELFNRPKQGFAIPLSQWLKNPLRDWVEYLLAEEKLQQQGFFKPKPIRQKWEEHLSGKRNWQYYLWNILMFQAWLEST